MTKIQVDSNGKAILLNNKALVASEGGVTPTGTLSITANGVYDVTNYASANVSVSGGGSATLYAWVTDDDNYIYTLTENPVAGDKFIAARLIGDATEPFVISTLESGLYAGDYGYVEYRKNNDDIVL